MRDWIKALRSREYKQGRGALKAKVGDEFVYCCLGVACEIAGLENEPRTADNYFVFKSLGTTMDSAYMPNWLGDLLGITNYHQFDLSLMNDRTDDDGAGVNNFNDIADWLEEQFGVEES